MRTQVSRAERLAGADDVIDNSGSLEALRKQVGALHQKYLQFART
jgi:dephospho-CoA kinase